MKKVSQLSVMDRMVKEDNKGIALSTTLISVEKVPQGIIAGFGLETSIGKHAELQTLGLPNDYMFMCFAVKKEAFEGTKLVMENEDFPKNGVELISEERKEQIQKHGWNIENDSHYENEELLQAAVYCISQEIEEWPTGWNTFFQDKILSKDRIGQLKVAGAFVAAEIDRLQAL